MIDHSGEHLQIELLNEEVVDGEELAARATWLSWQPQYSLESDIYLQMPSSQVF